MTPHEVRVESPRAGFVTEIDTAEVGHAVAALGGGRTRIEDAIDHAVGYSAEAKIGDRVSEGDVLGLLYCRDSSEAQESLERIRAAYALGDEPVSAPPLIKEVITA